MAKTANIINETHGIVIMLALVFVCLLASVAYANQALMSPLKTCTEDTDCIVLHGICGNWEAVNKEKATDAEHYFNDKNAEIDCPATPTVEPTGVRCNKGKCAIAFYKAIEDSCYKHTNTNQSSGWCQCVAMDIDASEEIMPQTKSLMEKHFPTGSPTNIDDMKFPDSFPEQADKLRSIFTHCVLQTTN